MRELDGHIHTPTCTRARERENERERGEKAPMLVQDAPKIEFATTAICPNSAKQASLHP